MNSHSQLPQDSDVDARTHIVTAVLFANEKDNQPEPGRGRLVDLLGTVHEKRSTKAGAGCFSMVIYEEGKKRGNSGVLYLTAIVLDLDHVTCEELNRGLQWLSKHAGAAYTSFSDRAGGPDDRCARLVALLTRPVTPEEGKVVRADVVQQLGIPVDEQASDAARIWYRPTCPPDRWEGSFIVYSKGPLLDPDPIVTTAAPAAPAGDHKPIAAQQWRDLIESGASQGSRHGALRRLTAHLLGKGVDAVVVLHLVRAWNAANNSPPTPDDEVVAIVDYVAARELTRTKWGGRS